MSVFLRRIFIWLLGVQFCFWSAAAPTFSAEGPCSWDGEPLLDLHWERFDLTQSPADAGTWALPISSSRPDLITNGRAHLALMRSSTFDPWQIAAEFYFAEPISFGLPFTFYHLEASWDDSQGPQSVMLDWTADCTSPGPGIFPGQRFSDSLPLKVPASATEIQNLSIRIWGSRN